MMASQILMLNASPDSFVRLKTPALLLGQQYRPLEPLGSEAA